MLCPGRSQGAPSGTDTSRTGLDPHLSFLWGTGRKNGWTPQRALERCVDERAGHAVAAILHGRPARDNRVLITA